MHSPSKDFANQPAIKKRKLWLLVPLFGTLIFVSLYLVATLLYPGGSQADRNSIGFSWADNYWCNLLTKEAMDGQPNPARPVAIAGMIVLCVSLATFWYSFPLLLQLNKSLRILIQASGTVSMALSFLLFTLISHDLATDIASVFGIIATAGTIAGLYKARWLGLFGLGLANILLVAINNYVYYSAELIRFLPVIQKISFASFLIWICLINGKLFWLGRHR